MTARLPFAGNRAVFALPPSRGNSTRSLFRGGLLRVEHYDNARAGRYRAFYRWNGREFAFEREEQVRWR